MKRLPKEKICVEHAGAVRLIKTVSKKRITTKKTAYSGESKTNLIMGRNNDNKISGKMDYSAFT